MGGFSSGLLWGMGYKLATDEKKGKKICLSCGRKVPEYARYCPYCGKPVY
jgi:predicted amidophosphoribosyltransferase